MSGILILILWIVYSVVIFKVKHRLFTVYYTTGGFIRELILIAFFGRVFAQITVELLLQFLPIIVLVLVLLAAGVMLFNRTKQTEENTETEETSQTKEL